MSNDLMQHFERYLTDKNGAVSVKGYMSDARKFLAWTKDERGVELTIPLLQTEPHLLNKAVIEAFIKNLHAEKYAISTIARHAASMRVFGNFLAARGITPINPAEKVKIEKLPLPDPRGLTDEERAKLEYVFRTPWERTTNKTKRKRKLDLAPKLIVRDRAIMLTLMYAGPRVSELVNIDVHDVTLKDRSGWILIRNGKGGQPRKVDIPKQVREALADWLDVRRTFPARDDALFIELKRSFSRLTQRTIQNMLVDASKRCGVNVTPHTLRHTYAYMLMHSGVHPKTAAALMGHSLEMALRYGSSKDEDKRNAAESLDNKSIF
ncbi:MAG: tyrosine-type recombinase/integrase [Anaerolineales bacterium]|nr:MAG: tyrosine-type recombinase/integrase [Anaerolineales bacterium]